MGVCWALAGNVMLLAVALYAGLENLEESGLSEGARWLSLALALPSVVYGGSEFFTRAWQSARLALRQRDLRLLHMDTPISIGILVGFGHSVWAVFVGSGQIWFDSITVLIAALLTARWLQLRSRRAAGDAAAQLTSMVPARVRRISATGPVEVVDAAEIQSGDLVEVLAGDVIPVDGIVVSGTSRLNNAVMSGESRLLDVAPDSEVAAGASNIFSPIRVRATAAGSSTRLGRLLEWASRPSPDRAPIIEFANRLTGYFVSGVLLLGLITLVLWMRVDSSVAVSHVVAVLVITCPCALGMATPLAMAVGAGQAARRGIFVRDGSTLQRLSHIGSVVLDKTGTLTTGNLSLVAVHGDREALAVAASLESHVSHPIARALTAEVPRIATSVTDVQSVPGGGVRGIVDGRDVAVGSLPWLISQGAEAPPDVLQTWTEVNEKGLTPVAVAVEGTVRMVAGLGDAVREEAGPLVRGLEQRGIRVFLASGDQAGVVAVVAGGIGIRPVAARSGMSPEDKVRWVEELREVSDGGVAFVGDGVNDAAALRAADVGISVDGGSAVSQMAADVFLRQPGVAPIVSLIDGAGHLMKVVRFNLSASLLYNLVGGIAAVAGFVSPLAAAVAMPLSSLFVVAVSVTQRSFRTPAPVRIGRRRHRSVPAGDLVFAGGQ
jgi:Cu2+-exporting ATPase